MASDHRVDVAAERAESIRRQKEKAAPGLEHARETAERRRLEWLKTRPTYTRRKKGAE